MSQSRGPRPAGPGPPHARSDQRSSQNTAAPLRDKRQRSVDGAIGPSDERLRFAAGQRIAGRRLKAARHLVANQEDAVERQFDALARVDGGSVATWSPGPTSRRRPSCTEERSMESPCQGAVSAARLRRGALGALGRSAPRRACALPAEQDCKPDEVTLGGVRRDRHGSRLSLGRELSMRSP
jgi:hypothetical protein